MLAKMRVAPQCVRSLMRACALNPSSSERGVESSFGWGLGRRKVEFGRSSRNFSSRSFASGPPARIVLNHTTHCPGAIDFLRELSDLARSDINTIVPGRLTTSKGGAERLACKVGVPVTGGFKLIIRKGTSVQEAFIVTQLQREALEAHVEAALLAGRKRG
jgi:hypothetical protein